MDLYGDRKGWGWGGGGAHGVEEGLGPDSMPCEVWCCEMERCNTILTIAYQTPDALAGEVQ